MKPSDAFLGIIDFFSTLVPGAVAAFLLLYQNKEWLSLASGWGSAERWAAFLVAAYLLGHAIAAVGSLLDKPVYDRVYARWKRTKTKLPEKSWAISALRWSVLKPRMRQVWEKENPDGGLLAAAKALKRKQLQELVQGTGYGPGDVSNAFWWAGTVVRLKSPAGKTEIEGLQGQSKLFRSMIVILVLAAPGWPLTPKGLGIWILLLALSLWRFCRLRWDSTERTYEYFLALAVPGIGPPEGTHPSSEPTASS